MLSYPDSAFTNVGLTSLLLNAVGSGGPNVPDTALLAEAFPDGIASANYAQVVWADAPAVSLAGQWQVLYDPNAGAWRAQAQVVLTPPASWFGQPLTTQGIGVVDAANQFLFWLIALGGQVLGTPNLVFLVEWDLVNCQPLVSGAS